MSDFSTLAASVQGSRPAELYTFSTPLADFRYTNVEGIVVVNGLTFSPRTIQRDPISSSVADRNRVLFVQIPTGDDFARLFIGIAPSYKALLKIEEVELDETPAPVPHTLFLGEVQGVEFGQQALVASIGVKGIDGARDTTIPRRGFGSLCGWNVYDADCKANTSGHGFLGVCTGYDSSPAGPIVTVPGAGGSGLKFLGGFCGPSGSPEVRMVVQQDGDNLTLLTGFTSDPTGEVLSCLEGCDHDMQGDCGNRFDNVQNYGGFRWVPSKSPWTSSLIG